jgi:hypothetical protein
MAAGMIRRIDILRVAAANDRGRYLLSRRMEKVPIGTAPNPDSIEQTWEICQELVSGGLARFLTNDEGGPGIELNGKGFYVAGLEGGVGGGSAKL